MVPSAPKTTSTSSVAVPSGRKTVACGPHVRADPILGDATRALGHRWRRGVPGTKAEALGKGFRSDRGPVVRVVALVFRRAAPCPVFRAVRGDAEITLARDDGKPIGASFVDSVGSRLGPRVPNRIRALRQLQMAVHRLGGGIDHGGENDQDSEHQDELEQRVTGPGMGAHAGVYVSRPLRSGAKRKLCCLIRSLSRTCTLVPPRADAVHYQLPTMPAALPTVGPSE